MIYLRWPACAITKPTAPPAGTAPAATTIALRWIALRRVNSGESVNANFKPGIGQNSLTPDSDPQETKEWLESLEAVIRQDGPERGLFLIGELEEQLRRLGVRFSVQPYSAYRNSIPLERQLAYPGNLELEERITSIIRWRSRANRR